MAENSQSAVVQELYRRRDSLAPDKQVLVDELAKRFNIATDKFEQTKAELESRPTGILESAKQFGKMLISPITSIPSAAGEAADFLLHPGSVAARNLNPETANGIPGAMSVSPAQDAYGSTVAAALTARGTPTIHQAAIDRLKAAGPPEPAPTPPEEPAPAGGGIVSNIRKVYKLYKAVKNASPTRLAEKGFEEFLDYVEGKTPDAPKPTVPSAPAPAPSATPVPEAIPPIYEELAQSLAKKSFADLDAAGQATVKRVAEQKPPAQAPRPAYTPRSMADYGVPEKAPEITATAPAPLTTEQASALPASRAEAPKPEPIPISQPLTKATIKPKAAEIAQQLHDEMAASGTSPAANGAEPLPKEAQIPSSVYEAEARHVKSDTVAKALFDNGISFEDAKKLMTVADWRTVFEGLGEHGPGSFSGDPTATVGQTLLKLRALEKGAKKTAPSVSTVPLPPDATVAAQALADAMKESGSLPVAVPKVRRSRVAAR